MAGGQDVTPMPKILVIEDEPDQNKLIKLRLEAHGFTVLSFGKAREGLVASIREKPDLILMDMILPDMHGLDAAIKLKQNPATRAIPVIALSAVGSPDFTKACLQEGIVDYIRKPYDPRELFKIIGKFVRIEKEPRKDKPAAKQPKDSPPPPAPPKRRPGKEPRKAPSIDEMLRGALADFDVPIDKSRPSLPSSPATNQKGLPRSKVVLVIDDDTSFSRVVSTHLTGHGYEVNLAADGITGLKQAFLKKPDLVLLNLILPGSGGETVLENLRKAPESGLVPIFIMSSLLTPKELEERARELGAQGFISKPVHPEELLYIIESIIGACP
jgi:two-component system cell cycle response regulator DivK